MRQRRDAGIGAHGRARFRAFDQVLADRIIVGLHKGLPAGLRFEEVLAADPAEVARACALRDDFLHEQVCEIAERTPPGPLREMNRAVGPLLRQRVRLRHRPGRFI